MAPVHFHEQYNSFHAQGHGAAPEGSSYVGDPEGLLQLQQQQQQRDAPGPKRRRVAQASP